MLLVLVLLAVPLSGAARGETIFAVTNASPPVLESFDSATPGTVTVIGAVSGLQASERLRGIDFRPATGLLYGVGDTSRLYRIDDASAAATQVGAGPFSPALSDSSASIGVAFDPVSDRLRVVLGGPNGSAPQNLRIDPDTGAAATQTTLAFGTGQPPLGDDSGFNLHAAAYTNGYPGATSTTLFDFDYHVDRILRQGDPGGSPLSAASGQLFVVGYSGISTASTKSMGMTISPAGIAYGGFTADPGPAAHFYAIDLSTGAFTPVGDIGSGTPNISGIAHAPVRNVFQFSQPSFSVSESAGSGTVTVTRSNRFGPASVDFATSDGSALATQDYTATAGTLSFADGETSKTFTVPVNDQPQLGGTKTVTLALINPLGGPASLGTPAQATLTIVYDDIKPLPALAISDIVDFKIAPSVIVAAPTGPTVVVAKAQKKRKTGAIVSYTASQPATTTFTVQRPAAGRRQAGKCTKPSKSNHKRKRCTRYLSLGSFTHADIAGADRFRFTARLHGHKLKPGKYRLQAIPRNAAGTGPRTYTPFRVKK